MKTKLTILPLVTILFLLACQLVTSTKPQPSVPIKEIRTEATATVFSDQTATAPVKGSVFQAALTADALTAAVRTPIPTLATFDISVPASACWMNSQVSVHAGQKVLISASGMVNTYGGKGGSDNEPNGQKSICGAIECPVQGVGYGALIGRLNEDGKPFFVGSKFELVATKDGQLYFTVNDWTCEDNSGTFELKITVK
jgi:hypothetical protein